MFAIVHENHRYHVGDLVRFTAREEGDWDILLGAIKSLDYEAGKAIIQVRPLFALPYLISIPIADIIRKEK